jgi:hypothetical protein
LHFGRWNLISTKGARRVWPVSRGCLLFLGTWSNLRICRRSVLPHTRFCNLISTKGARRVWPVSRGCLLLLGTRSYLRICRRSVLPNTRFCNCLLDYDFVLHIVNFCILYFSHNMDLNYAPPFNLVLLPLKREAISFDINDLEKSNWVMQTFVKL